MVRFRRLQQQDEQGQWYDDSYAIEGPDNQVHFRYNLAWDGVGSRYYGKIQQSDVALEQIHQVLYGNGLRWLAVETLDMTYADATDLLDPHFHIPRPKKSVVAQSVQ
jgi:hypothetical protein